VAIVVFVFVVVLIVLLYVFGCGCIVGGCGAVSFGGLGDVDFGVYGVMLYSGSDSASMDCRVLFF
jgi:hypothetical protein